MVLRFVLTTLKRDCGSFKLFVFIAVGNYKYFNFYENKKIVI